MLQLLPVAFPGGKFELLRVCFPPIVGNMHVLLCSTRDEMVHEYAHYALGRSDSSIEILVCEILSKKKASAGMPAAGRTPGNVSLWYRDILLRGEKVF